MRDGCFKRVASIKPAEHGLAICVNVIIDLWNTTASLRAMEVGAEVILKATKVDGVYDADPLKHEGANKFEELSYIEVLNRELKVMDSTAISLCMDNNLPIIVFNLMEKGNIKRVVSGEPIGTLVSGGKR